MLELTSTASEVVTAIVTQQDLPESAGMRITSEEGAPTPNGSAPSRDIRLSVVEAPQDDDQEVEGAPVYVESGETAELLDDKVLDANVEGEEVQFRLMGQPG